MQGGNYLEFLITKVFELTEPEKNGIHLTIPFIVILILTTIILRDKQDVISFIEVIFPNKSHQLINKVYTLLVKLLHLFSKFNFYTFISFLFISKILSRPFIPIFVFQWKFGILLIAGLLYSFLLNQEEVTLKDFVNKHIIDQRIPQFIYNIQIFIFVLLLIYHSLKFGFSTTSYGFAVFLTVAFIFYTGKTAKNDLFSFIKKIIDKIIYWYRNQC